MLRHPLYIAIPSFVLSERTSTILDSFASSVSINQGPRPSREELAHLLESHPWMIIGIKERIDQALLESIQCKTQLLGTLSIGTDHLDLKACEDKGIQVINSPTGNVSSVAEHTVASLLALRKEMYASNQAVRLGLGRKGLTAWPRDLRGMTVGLVGAGRIAFETAQYLRVFGVNLKGWTFRPERHTEFDSLGMEWVPDLKTLFSSCDAVSLHIPLTSTTQDMVTSSLLSQIATQPFALINTSRAGLIAKDALPEAFQKGWVTHAALDVLRTDETPKQYPEESVYLSPHVAGVTEESLERLSYELASRMSAYVLEEKSTL